MIARGSAFEVVAAYELAATYEEDVPLEEIRREGRAVISMLPGSPVDVEVRDQGHVQVALGLP